MHYSNINILDFRCYRQASGLYQDKLSRISFQDKGNDITLCKLVCFHLASHRPPGAFLPRVLGKLSV
ncbi:hypothetical protein ANAPC3_00622 [Anaplasma phagocytophilum]|nr:hypothetical protein ANAPC3_00622 [Anaplasma phagocytophilum]SBO32190.1 hypothetical protein ANAPC4_00726 [Anaplasma phagocytophilum]